MPDPVIMQHFQVSLKPDGTLWELGRGAMGVTYKAVDIELGGTVALKVINSHHLNDANSRERFLREARAAAYLHHPNIASVFHLGREGDSYFYAMEFVEGETLQSVVEREGALPPRLALRLILQTAQGLFAANERGLIHRDIKPANLMLTRHEGGGGLDDDDLLVKVIDFGLAKSVVEADGVGVSLTGGSPIGTPYYMSPEQIEPSVGAVDARSDIYSLGVTLWCLLTGKPPFVGTQFQVFSQHLNQPPPLTQLAPLHVPPGVGALLERMLAKEPEKRPASHRELINDLRALLRAMPAAAAEIDPAATLCVPPHDGQTPPAPRSAEATAGFPLVEVLRARGSLLAADVLALLRVLAPEIDAAGREGSPELRPTAVLLRFSPPPANLDALPGTSMPHWPAFTCVLRPRTGAAGAPAPDLDDAGEQTLVPGGSRDDGSDDVTRLAMLVYELLGGQPHAMPTPDAPARPLPTLGESANAVLWRALRGGVPGRGAFASATELAGALAAAVQADGTLSRAGSTTVGRLNSTLPPPGATIDPAVPPASHPPAPRRKVPAIWLASGALGLAALVVATWWFTRGHTSPAAATATIAPVVPAAPTGPAPEPSRPGRTGPSPVVVAAPVQSPAPPMPMGDMPSRPAANPSPATPAVIAAASPALTPGSVSPVPVPPAAMPAGPSNEEEQEEKLLAQQEAHTKAARTLRVPRQYPTIQAAIDAAQSGDTVSVGPGHYREALHFKEGLRLIGTDRDSVIVTTSADADALMVVDCAFGKISEMTFRQTPPPEHVEAQPAVFIKDSAVQLVHCRVTNASGVSIYLRGHNESTVENCEVLDSGSDGIHIMDAGAKPTVRGNHVEGGHTNGIFLHMHGTGTIINNTSERNAGSGIAMFGADVNPQVQGNHFLHNGKWGIQITRPANPQVGTDNVLKGNEMGSAHEETPPAVPDHMPGMGGM